MEDRTPKDIQRALRKNLHGQRGIAVFLWRAPSGEYVKTVRNDYTYHRMLKSQRML